MRRSPLYSPYSMCFSENKERMIFLPFIIRGLLHSHKNTHTNTHFFDEENSFFAIKVHTGLSFYVGIFIPSLSRNVCYFFIFPSPFLCFFILSLSTFCFFSFCFFILSSPVLIFFHTISSFSFFISLLFRYSIL